MQLREIVYLDGERVDSYISQLAGGLTVEESAQTSTQGRLSGSVKASIKVVEFQVGAEQGSGAEAVIKRVPAHAKLSTLEQLLESASMITDPHASTPLPGQICRLSADATFESWGLLASLADSIQGLASLGLGIYSATRGEQTLRSLQQQLKELERVLKKRPNDAAARTAVATLGAQVSKLTIFASMVEGRQIEDVKEIVKLFFQNQNHIRLSTKERTFVGLLRSEHLVGCTMNELVFTYGSRPMGTFEALFYVSELGTGQELDPAQIGARFVSIAQQGLPFTTLRETIRQVGTLLLECAEQLRRPDAADAVFMVPLAVFRTIRCVDNDRRTPRS
jgi:hypothetical protein